MTKSRKLAPTPEGGDELAELAERYVDLWQDQATALAADATLAEALTRLCQASSAGPNDPQERPEDGTAHGHGSAAGIVAGIDAGADDDGLGPAPKGGSAPAAVAPGLGADDVDRLARCLAVRAAGLAAVGAPSGGGGGQAPSGAGGGTA